MPPDRPDSVTGGAARAVMPYLSRMGRKWARPGRAFPGGGAGRGGGDTYILNIHSLQTSQDISRAIVQGLKEYKRHGGGSALGIA